MRAYFHAKDEEPPPHGARIRPRRRAENGPAPSSFAFRIHGLAAADTLVRKFKGKPTAIYVLPVATRGRRAAPDYQCDWIVTA